MSSEKKYSKSWWVLLAANIVTCVSGGIVLSSVWWIVQVDNHTGFMRAFPFLVGLIGVFLLVQGSLSLRTLWRAS